MSAITFHSEETSFSLPKEKAIFQWITNAVQSEGFLAGNISIIFCSDDYLLNINQKHLSHDYYTDIITFDYCENGIVNGDLFISIDRVKDNAKDFSVSFEHELYRVIIHGIMHLCGYKDKSDEEMAKIRQKENFYLSLHPDLKTS